MTRKNCPAAVAGRTVVGKSRARWNGKRKSLFLAALTDTANVRKSAAAAGMSLTAAYDLKARDPAFAQAWREALEIGYSEVELMLLRESLHGSERTEMVEEGAEKTLKYVKTVRSFNFPVAMRLFMAHREEVLAFRRARDGDEAPEQGATERLQRYLDEIRMRLAECEAEIGDAEAGDGESGDAHGFASDGSDGSDPTRATDGAREAG
ncbi:MAG TPA: hypothetical protein VNS79_14270 [Sphingobium sp.]|nr:hypothetical protein [Sphingobium sp.]